MIEADTLPPPPQDSESPTNPGLERAPAEPQTRVQVDALTVAATYATVAARLTRVEELQNHVRTGLEDLTVAIRALSSDIDGLRGAINQEFVVVNRLEISQEQLHSILKTTADGVQALLISRQCPECGGSLVRHCPHCGAPTVKRPSLHLAGE